jgi:hypothetical protein
MGGACSPYGEEGRSVRGLVVKDEGRDHLGDPGLDGRIILRWNLRKWDVGAWI